MNKRIVWFHIHIPKSGGSTLNSILKKIFGTGYRANYSLLNRIHVENRSFSF